MHPAGLRLAVLVAALTLASCGGGGKTADGGSPQAGGRTLPLTAEDDQVQAHRLVSASDVRSAAPGSAQRAFYEYWSAIENQEWPIAVRFFLPQIQRALVPDRLMAALHGEAQWPPIKPLIRGVRQARGDQVSVRYFVRQPDGALRPTSMIFRRLDGSWYIAYSATLDDNYRTSEQARVQAVTAPNDPTPSAQATAAGQRAVNAQARALNP